VAEQAGDLAVSHTQLLLALRHFGQIRPIARVDGDDPFKGDADAGELGRHMDEAVAGPIEIDNQAFHVGGFDAADAGGRVHNIGKKLRKRFSLDAVRWRP